MLAVDEHWIVWNERMEGIPTTITAEEFREYVLRSPLEESSSAAPSAGPRTDRLDRIEHRLARLEKHLGLPAFEVENSFEA